MKRKFTFSSGREGSDSFLPFSIKTLYSRPRNQKLPRELPSLLEVNEKVVEPRVSREA